MKTASGRVHLAAVADALADARVPGLYRRALLEELETHAEASSRVLIAAGVDEDEAWRLAVAELGPPELVANAAAGQAQTWPYRAPWLTLVAAPPLAVAIAIPGLATLALMPWLPAHAAASALESWIPATATLTTGAVTTVAAAVLRDLRQRHTGTAGHVRWGITFVVLVAACFSVSIDAGDLGPVVRAHYGWPVELWQACPAALAGWWPAPGDHDAAAR